MWASIAASMASRESIIAPSSDSSASMLCGGTRAVLRERTSSIDWTTSPLLGSLRRPRNACPERTMTHQACGEVDPQTCVRRVDNAGFPLDNADDGPQAWG